MELYENLGFKKNPFSTFSAEEEMDFIDQVFLDPPYLNSLKENVCSGHSRFILGARGVGKTSLIYKLRSVCNEKNCFSIIVDDYEGISKSKNKVKILNLIIESLTKDYSIALLKNPSLVKNISKENKEKLSFVINNFFKTISNREYTETFNRISKYKTRNKLKTIFNFFLNKPVNIAISGAVEILSDTVRKSLGLPTTENEKYFRAYIPELTLEDPTTEKLQASAKSDAKSLKSILEDLSHIINESGLGRPVIFFDKIDEYPALSSNISQISNFIEDILTDTALLLNPNFSLVFSIWDAIKPGLANKGVRFDKVKPVDVTWSNDDLLRILNKRLEHFGNTSKGHKDIIRTEGSIEKIIELSTSSPRYMFRLLSVIYDQQNNTNSTSSSFESHSINEGLMNFSQSFDFYAVFPGKRGTKDDVMTHINRLLKLGKTEITTKDFVTTYKVSSQTAINYIKTQQEYDLIHKTGERDGQAPIYRIKNSVIAFLIENQIPEIAA